MSRKPKVKWTDQMNLDVLECKTKAQELVASDRGPVNCNGRKKGYIEIMKDLWDAKGYGHFELKGQNLRDQASRLEKNQRRSVNTSGDNTNATIEINNSTYGGGTQPVSHIDQTNTTKLFNLSVQTTGSGDDLHHANSQATTSNDLHMASTPEIPGDVGITYQTEQNDQDNESVLGCLPEHNVVNKPRMITWGKRDDGSLVVLSTSLITDAYNEIVKWKKNAFLVPYGKIGREFIDQVTLHINDWNNGSDNQHISLKAAFVLLAVALQKPGPKSKAKDHQDALSKRLALWRDRQGKCSNELRKCLTKLFKVYIESVGCQG